MTTEQMLVALGYVSIIGGLFLLVLWLERRTQLLKQVEVVRDRLTAPPRQPRYRTRVQLENVSATGQMVEFTSRVPLPVGTMVTADIRGELAPMGPNSRAVGRVVWQEVQL